MILVVLLNKGLLQRLFVPIQDRNPEEALLKIEDPELKINLEKDYFNRRHFAT
jgi:hypothetical protein